MSAGLTDTLSDTQTSCLQRFQSSVDGIDLPEIFAYPFYYDPHPLAKIAALELQEYLNHQTDFEYNFGIGVPQDSLRIGKMFGILVVEDEKGGLGYLQAFSGKIADTNDHKGFVPPVFDMLKDGDFFDEGMKVITSINKEIIKLESDSGYQNALLDFEEWDKRIKEIIKENRANLKERKKERKRRRQAATDLGDQDKKELVHQLAQESLEMRRDNKAIEKYWQIRLFYKQLEVNKFKNRIDQLKAERKRLSIDLQQQLFDQYNFLNQAGESKNVLDIFKNTAAKVPPSAAGECAAPKLFQYAFQHNLKPICMAEFWWGRSPKSEVKHHGNYYPSCRGKCEPILGHMLQGVPMEANPMLVNPAVDKEVEVIYEDDAMAIVNKPADMLSVPGKTIEDSVWKRMRDRYPDADGPLIVHRLDMSTSGILLIAKSKEVHKHLQNQFIKRTIKKRYIAVLDGLVEEDDGTIDLPLRVDLDDRPRQLVCYDHGKSGRTNWKVIERNSGQTRIHFYPITGRTHQLRVHAAHCDGLGIPIVGDDLYGQKGTRLHLHAEWIQFVHPTTEEIFEMQVDAAF